MLHVSVIKRLENVQVNLVDISNKEELLNVSKNLRVQQEKTKELESQVTKSRLPILAILLMQGQ